MTLEVITPGFGRVGMVARGVRRPQSRQRAVLEPFVPLWFSWHRGKGDLATLTGAETSGPGSHLGGTRLLAGWYLNELLLRLLPREDAHPVLFTAYARALRGLSESRQVASVLRCFEKVLLEELGYGFSLEMDTDGNAVAEELVYLYRPEAGLVELIPGTLSSKTEPVIHGRCARAFARDDLADVDADCQRQARELMRAALAPHLGPRPLQSRALLLRVRNGSHE